MKEELKKLHQKARIDRDASGTQAYGAALAAIQESEVRANEDFDEAKRLKLRIEKVRVEAAPPAVPAAPPMSAGAALSADAMLAHER